MKAVKFLLIPLIASVISVAHAGPLQAKQVNLPFENELVYSDTHQGLYFTYDMGQNPAKKIVCDITNYYKGEVAFREHGALRMATGNVVILTSKGEDDEYSNQFHADAKGAAKINDWGKQAKNSHASCHYEFDDNV